MKLKRKIKQDKVFTIISGAARKKRDFLGVMEVRSKILTPLETTGGNSFSLEGFEKMLFIIKTLRRVTYIPLEGFSYPS